MQHYIDSFTTMVSLRGLAGHTLKSYSSYLKSYLSYLTDHLHKLPEDVSWDELRQYILFLQNVRSLSDRSINAHISQLKFFTLYVLHKPWDPYQIPFRRFDSYLPEILSQEEVRYFIDSFDNLKHKAVISLLYSAGLRVGEVCHLKYKDISRRNMTIHISHSKNRSDRYAILASNALDILTDYWLSYGKPTDWLFPSTFTSDKPICSFTVNRFVNQHLARLGWNKNISSHTFRHCFGTHLYENGVDLLTIKSLLGHKSLSSTTIYVHLGSNGVHSTLSPFDMNGGMK
ncbi:MULTISPECIES: tyrosine-type recombinase/integrase [Lacrimispora]|uniref:tyrosine-type recombinase/integrase n=1 Tax=Lacrimispora TaxID=2719231 RepID=UPI000BE3CAEA|nr:tyrosine-type recombinase/integrase [Lacrimispora amygdalina]MDK2967166.1 integrase/recombinase XerD [Lacrimispora sp.]